MRATRSRIAVVSVLAFAFAVACACAPYVLGAQRMADGSARSPRPAIVPPAPLALGDSFARAHRRVPLVFPALPRRDSSWWVPLASTVLPGAGQLLLGQDRFLAYVAVEGFALLNAIDRATEERRLRDRSRALALDVARKFVTSERPIGDWHYYENMEKYVESGVLNRAPPGAEFAPEVDVTTHNGFLWLDVRQRYWKDPSVEPAHASAEYRNALREYLERAYQEPMRWSWRNAQLEQDLYRQTIRSKNEASHDATMFLGALAANHLLSTIDAFVTVRLRGGAGATGTPSALSLSVPWAPFGRPWRR